MRLFVCLFFLCPPPCVTFILSHFSVIQIIPPLLLAPYKQKKSPFPPKPSKKPIRRRENKKAALISSTMCKTTPRESHH